MIVLRIFAPLRKSSRQVIAGLCLGVLIGQTSFAQIAAVQDLQERAQAGDVAAQRDLATRLETGDGVLQDFGLAVEWARAAAKAGDASAQNQLGRLYFEGKGVQQNEELAFKWLTTAAAQGDPTHKFDLAVALNAKLDDPKALEQAAALYQEAADAGLIEAALRLGVLYQEGIGVPQDFVRARTLYEGPAAAGNAQAQNNLGLLYVRGNGVPQDYTRAVELFQAAAQQGLRPAMTNLGVMYENGFGVPVNEAEATELYRLGGNADQGATESPFVYDSRLMPPETDAQALETLHLLASEGDPIAEFQLAYLISQGHPLVVQNWTLAAKLYRSAAEKGYHPAMVNLGILYFEGRGVPQDFVYSIMWLTLAQLGLPQTRSLRDSYSISVPIETMQEAQKLAADWQILRRYQGVTSRQP